jgi:site-specific DNA recombinase
MENKRQPNPDYEKYRGMRALLLTRVSTGSQSHDAQERVIRELLIEAFQLRLNEERHVIHDTYTGLDYRYREALDDILNMAERREFDVLCLDVLDRGLGRKGVSREIFRAQLRDLGIHILTTEPSDHSDDDSLEGQLMRLLKGYKAEEEVNDLVRRARNGKRHKALGDPDKNVPGAIIGNGDRLYGYKFVENDKGKRVNFTPNLDVIFVEADGTEWTEVGVVVFIFESAANGASLRSIGKLLDVKGIPTPHVTKGKKIRRDRMTRKVSAWYHATILRIIRNTAYYGEYVQFQEACIGRQPGRKTVSRRATTQDEQVIIPIPAIITKELYEKANRRIQFNKQLATRNNKRSQELLLRGGFARCAYCGYALQTWSHVHRRVTGEKVTHMYYQCAKPTIDIGQRCGGCCIPAKVLDSEVTDYIFALIHDPSELDKKIEDFKKNSSVKKQKERKLANITDIRKQQTALRNNLTELLKQEVVDIPTRNHINGQLQILAKQEEEALQEFADEQAFQEKYNKLEQRVAKFHRQCEEWRNQLDNPEFTPTFDFKREALLFLGVTVTVWRAGTEPRFVPHSDPPEIMELLS